MVTLRCVGTAWQAHMRMIDSINFDEMDQKEFNQYFEMSMAKLAEAIGYDPIEVTYETNKHLIKEEELAAILLRLSGTAKCANKTSITSLILLPINKGSVRAFVRVTMQKQ